MDVSAISALKQSEILLEVQAKLIKSSQDSYEAAVMAVLEGVAATPRAEGLTGQNLNIAA